MGIIWALSPIHLCIRSEQVNNAQQALIVIDPALLPSRGEFISLQTWILTRWHQINNSSQVCVNTIFYTPQARITPTSFHVRFILMSLPQSESILTGALVTYATLDEVSKVKSSIQDLIRWSGHYVCKNNWYYRKNTKNTSKALFRKKYEYIIECA